MFEDKMPPLDGLTIAAELLSYGRASNWSGLSFWAGVAAARLIQYQRALEAAGIELPEHD